ncbi:hypothetical protein NQ317_002172 [Molorchus minor]|uniref:Uncharacterized protein n=1 Tax=Molorchus minor TaxID=1323400 RepID=A0ABQ9J5I1_9CUCU|nr:hypothetical protein NQ317_002172 [Molorchus minor]
MEDNVILIFGAPIRISGDREIDNRSAEDPENMIEKVEVMQKVYKVVTKRLKSAYEKSRRVYNLRHRNETFSLNQRVWKPNPVLSDVSKGITAKLSPKFVEPFIVQKVVSLDIRIVGFKWTKFRHMACKGPKSSSSK